MPTLKKKVRKQAPVRLWPITARKLKEMSQSSKIDMTEIAEWCIDSKFDEWMADNDFPITKGYHRWAKFIKGQSQSRCLKEPQSSPEKA